MKIFKSAMRVLKRSQKCSNNCGLIHASETTICSNVYFSISLFEVICWKAQVSGICKVYLNIL